MYGQGNTFFVGYTPGVIGGSRIRCDIPDMELRIDELLKEHDVSQSQLARDLGVKQPTVSRWVSGESSPPTKKLAEIAAYFKIDPLFLFKDYGAHKRKLEILKQIEALDDHDVLAVRNLVDTLSQRRDQ